MNAGHLLNVSKFAFTATSAKTGVEELDLYVLLLTPNISGLSLKLGMVLFFVILLACLANGPLNS